MSTALANTSWPDIAISSTGKDLIAKFFSLVDKPDPNAGKELAEEVFTENGVLAAGPNRFTGYEAISRSRENAWGVITGRRHQVLKVYASDRAGLDILMIGELLATVKSGKSAPVGFTARIVMGDTVKGLRIKHYEVWSDQTPLKTLIENS